MTPRRLHRETKCLHAFSKAERWSDNNNTVARTHIQHRPTYTAKLMSVAALLTVVLITACGNTVAVGVTSAATPLCPSPGAPVPSPQACLTASEAQAGLSLVTMKTIPSSVLLRSNINLTTSSTPSAITEARAIAAANKYAGVTDPKLVSDEAVYGSMHNVYGLPLSGQDVWVVNVSPRSITTPNPNPTGKYVYVTIDAATGQPIDESGEILHPNPIPEGPK